ncbi:MAG: hypothetical protein PUB18_05990 [bacterium]|nr:hypothetical protein [bacterium]
MDFVIELVLELLLEGSMEISSNKKISKWIRYPILALLILFFASIIFGIIILGILIIPDNIFGGIFSITVGLFVLVMSIFQFRKKYLEILDKK